MESCRACRWWSPDHPWCWQLIDIVSVGIHSSIYTNCTLNTETINQHKWFAPAKLNLFLHITGRRADGYHLLQTVFQLLDYGDELSFEVTDDGILSMQSPMDGVPDSQNLIVRAAMLLQSRTGCTKGAVVGINKRLPMGGGLGGGSSDAATTLRALNELWQTGLEIDELAALGLELGADVPVFVRGCSSWADGVGENLQPVTLPERWFVVLNPGVHVSTADLFSHPQLTRDCAAITIRGFQSGVGLCNVFQPLVSELFPPVKLALDELSQAAIRCNVREEDGRVRSALLTGTGACVFLACDSNTQAQNVLSGLPAGTAAFVARGLQEVGMQDGFAPQGKAVE